MYAAVKLAAVSALLAGANSYHLPRASSGVGLSLSQPLIQAPIPEQEQPLLQVPELVQPMTQAPEETVTHGQLHDEDAAMAYWSDHAETAPTEAVEETTAFNNIETGNLPTSMDDANGGFVFQAYGPPANTVAQESTTTGYSAPTTVASTTAAPTTLPPATTVASATVAPPQPVYGNMQGRRMRPRGRAFKPTPSQQYTAPAETTVAPVPTTTTVAEDIASSAANSYASDNVETGTLPTSTIDASGGSPYGSQTSTAAQETTTAGYSAPTTIASAPVEPTTLQPATTVASETVAPPQQSYGSERPLIQTPSAEQDQPLVQAPELVQPTTQAPEAAAHGYIHNEDAAIAYWSDRAEAATPVLPGPAGETNATNNLEAGNLPTSMDANGGSPYGARPNTIAEATTTAAYNAPTTAAPTTVAPTTLPPATTVASATVAPPQPVYGNMQGRRMRPHGRAFKPAPSQKYTAPGETTVAPVPTTTTIAQDTTSSAAAGGY